MGNLGSLLDDEVFGPRRGVDARNQQAADIFAASPLRTAEPAPPVEDTAFMRAVDKMLRGTTIVAAQPAHNAPAYMSLPVDVSGRISLPLAASDQWTTIASYQLEPGLRAVINGYGLDVQDGAYTYNGDIVFRVTVNGVSPQTLSEFKEHRGAVVTPRQTVIILKNTGDVVAVQVRRAVAGAGAVNIDAALVGWTWHPTQSTENSQAAMAI